MRWYRVLLVLCLVAGALLRARGFLYSARPFWVDEAAWSVRLLRSNLLEPSIRPVGFTALIRLLVACFGARDMVLRLVPWLAGMAAMLVAVPLAEALLPSRAARLLFVGTIALHPVAIDYSKEFKPYSCSLFLHLLCALFAARYLQDRGTRSLILGILSGFLGIWFAQDLIFALPGYYLVAGAFAWRTARRSHLVTLGVGAVATIASIILLYFFFWRAVDVGPAGPDTAVWAAKYDVFHRPGTGEGLLHWIGRKYVDLMTFPAARRESWRGHRLLGATAVGWFSTAYAALWAALHVLGIGVLVRERRFSALTLLFSPIVVLLGFGLLGLWPFGVFRTNLFLLAYVSLIAAFGVGYFKPLARWEVVPFAVAVALPLALFEREWHSHKRWAGESAFFDVTKELVAMQGEHAEIEPLVLDHWSCTVFHYYLSFNPDYAKLQRTLAHRFATKCRTEEDALPEAEHEASERRVWLVLSDPTQSRAAIDQMASLTNVVDYRKLDGGRNVLLELAPPGWTTQ
jgi:hypothetical protein